MSQTDYKPRLSIDITQEQYDRLQTLVPWGLRRQLFSFIIDDLLNLIETQGEAVIAVVLTRSLKPREVIKLMKDAEGRKRDDT